MKKSTLIHRMADWLDRKYLSQNTVSALPRSPWYELMASKEAAATTTASKRNGRQNQPRPTIAASAATRIGFS